MTTGSAPAGVFGHLGYTVRRKVFSFLGQKFHIYDDTGALIGYSKQKAFKLKEDIRIYTDDTMTTELLSIKARSVIDFSATYDVFDPTAGGAPLGSFRRKGWASTFFRDQWQVFSPQDQEIAQLDEDSGSMGFLRRYVPLVGIISPQAFHLTVGGQVVATMHTNRNPFVYKLSVNFTPQLSQVFDPRMALAGSILIAAIEGRQSSG